MGQGQILLLVALLVNLALGAVVVARDPHRTENRWFGLFCMCIVYWAQVEFLNSYDSLSAGEAFWFQALATPGWAFLIPVFLFFVRAHAGAFGLLRSNAFPILFVVSAATLSVVAWVPGWMIEHMVRSPYGGHTNVPGPVYVFLAIPHVTLGLTVAVAQLVIHMRRTRDPWTRKKAGVILVGVMVPVLGGLFVDRFLPNLGALDLLRLVLPMTALNAVIIGVGILRFRLFDVTPEATARTIVGNMTEGLFLTNASGEVMFTNPAAEGLLGGDAMKLRGTSLSQLIRPASDVEFGFRQALNGVTYSGEGTVKGRYGRIVPVEYTLVRAEEALDTAMGFVCVVRDVGPLKALIQQLEDASNRLTEQAITDPLTGVYNRRYLNSRLFEEFAASRRHKIPLSLIMLDLDRFKLVNDENGHDVGDKVLEEVANVLKKGFRASDVVTRYGGDEFLILMPHTQPAQAMEVAERIRHSIEVGDLTCEMGVTASIGVLTFDGNQSVEEAEELVIATDRAMMRSKVSGRNQVKQVEIDTVFH